MIELILLTTITVLIMALGVLLVVGVALAILDSIQRVLNTRRKRHGIR